MTMEMYERIKGYANVGNTDTLGYHGDTNEEADRIPNYLEDPTEHMRKRY